MSVGTLDYPFIARRLPPEDGGGWLVELPDLPGCTADGETIDEAVADAIDAAAAWIATAQELGRTVPEPGSIDQFSGKWVQRVPKSLHMRLADQAKREGVSLNQFVTALLAEGLGKKAAAA